MKSQVTFVLVSPDQLLSNPALYFTGDARMPTRHTFDLVVVGCGIAGLSAAVSAAERGARVAVLERAPFEDRGGQSRYTEAYLRMKSHSEVSDDFETHFAENGCGSLDPDLIERSAETTDRGMVRALSLAD